LCSSKTTGLIFFDVSNSNIGLFLSILLLDWTCQWVSMYADIIAFLTLLWIGFLDMTRYSCYTVLCFQSMWIIRIYSSISILLPWTGAF
jgi:hypothetical protein